MKTFVVSFNEAGGEYVGHLTVRCKTLRLSEKDNKTFSADGVIITIDEKIINVVEL